MKEASIEVVLKTGAFADLTAKNFKELSKGEEPVKVKQWAARLREAIGMLEQAENIKADKKDVKTVDVGKAEAELEEAKAQEASAASKKDKKELGKKVAKAEKNLKKVKKG